MSHHPAGRFDVRVQPAARRALAERLPEAVAAAALDFLDGPLADNPLRVGRPLAGPFAGCLGARRGTYRVIYRVDLDRRTVQSSTSITGPRCIGDVDRPKASYDEAFSYL